MGNRIDAVNGSYSKLKEPGFCGAVSGFGRIRQFDAIALFRIGGWDYSVR